MSFTEEDLEKIRTHLDARIEQYAKKLRAATSQFARDKLADMERTIIKAKDDAWDRCQKSIADAERYRETSTFLADTSIDAAKSQYRSAIESYGKLLDAYAESIKDHL